MIQDELIVHASIFPDEIASTLSDIQRSKLAPASRCYRVLSQKEFLRYANPFFYEDTCGTRQMEEYLTDNLGISQKDAEEIVFPVYPSPSQRLISGSISHAMVMRSR